MLFREYDTLFSALDQNRTGSARKLLLTGEGLVPIEVQSVYLEQGSHDQSPDSCCTLLLCPGDFSSTVIPLKSAVFKDEYELSGSRFLAWVLVGTKPEMLD